MHELPVQPDYHVLSGNCSLESNPDRHDESPLAVANSNGLCGASFKGILEVFAKFRLH
ncbi:replication initiation protein [Rouxiella silvae]|uniref:replication initiation protein n=1 Tax=Rouxiella silvae TaxID=1646373 RepID=UPI001301B481|nr:replication initiation protein [Rouxiella silvae]